MDRHRPLYHFTCGAWMNDPKPFFHGGEYHVFFQHNPHEAFWGKMHWGHAVSTDLAHWRELPIALAPTPGSPDADGCWTGCVVEDAGRFHILYTGIPESKPFRQVQCLATSGDLITWGKRPEPVITEMPDGFGPCFRDPQAWREADGWRMVIGSEVAGKGGAALLYESSDLIHWQYGGPMFVGGQETGHDFECPDFFPLGDRHVLLTSRGNTWWHIGDYEESGFTRRNWGAVDGGSFYAAKTLRDDQGRRILFGWIQETRSKEAQIEAGWSGALSLARVLTVLPGNRLGAAPAPELAALRREHYPFDAIALKDGEEMLLPYGEGDALEITVTFAPSDTARFGVLVRSSPDRAERTEIGYDRVGERLVETPFRLEPDEPLTLRIFVDRSIVEVFANNRASHTLRVYPERDDCLRVGLFAQGGPVTAAALDIWNLGGG